MILIGSLDYYAGKSKQKDWNIMLRLLHVSVPIMPLIMVKHPPEQHHTNE